MWSQKNETSGFPIGTNLYEFAFLNLPHPESIDPIECLNKYFEKNKWPTVKNSKSKGISMTNGDIPLLINYAGTTNPNVQYTWTKKSIKHLFKQLIKWWDSDKDYLLKEDEEEAFGSIKREFRERFKFLKLILINIIGNNHEFLSSTEKRSISRIIKEYPQYGLSNLRLKSGFIDVLDYDVKEIEREIYEHIFADDIEFIVDSIHAAQELINNGQIIESLVKAISENIKVRNSYSLTSFLTGFKQFVESHSITLSDEVLKDLTIGLENLLKESRIHNSDSSEEVDEKLRNLRDGSLLVIQMYNYYSKNGEPIPSYINEWKMACSNKEQFSEIRNIWEDINFYVK
ncbi:MAG: hypothetical protein ACNS60_08105 [Candidatus Cyclobacteriaceae bacterium M2_1C_046]